MPLIMALETVDCVYTGYNFLENPTYHLYLGYISKWHKEEGKEVIEWSLGINSSAECYKFIDNEGSISVYRQE